MSLRAKFQNILDDNVSSTPFKGTRSEAGENREVASIKEKETKNTNPLVILCIITIIVVLLVKFKHLFSSSVHKFDEISKKINEMGSTDDVEEISDPLFQLF